jgi:hypothetical protein
MEPESPCIHRRSTSLLVYVDALSLESTRQPIDLVDVEVVQRDLDHESQQTR